MKNYSLILVTSILATGCIFTKGPGDTLVEMRSKMCSSHSLQPMVEYSAPESQAAIGMIVGMAEDPKKGPEIKAKLEESCQKGKLSVVKEEIHGESAIVVLNDDGKPQTMRKIDGKWKMVISKK